MIEKIKEIYNGFINFQGERYTFEVAKPEDGEELAEIYKTIKIDINDYKIKLDPENENNFANKGGMFIVLNKEEIDKEIADEKNLWAVIKNSSGKIEGSFWYSEKNEAFSGTVYDNDKYIYPREIVTAENRALKYAGRILYYTVVEAMRRGGIKQGVCDVYKVKGYEAEGKSVQTQLLNIPSSKLLENVGADFKGPGKIKNIKLANLEVTIEPQIYYLDHNKICKKCEEFFKEKSVQISWS